jgi:hypothetical protein
MPSGLPPPSLLTSRKVGAFTLDTSVLRAAGYRFEQGVLRQLTHQLPPWLNLWMSSVVVREVERQRLAALEAAADQAKQAWTNLHRHLDQPPNNGPTHFEVDSMASGAASRFEDQMARLVATHNGEVVEVDKPWLASALFDAYFAGAAPFSAGSKKHEFPDAAALLSLDELARERDTYVLAVSLDDGWHEYCATSTRMYCLRKLSDLAGLFRSTGPEAQNLRFTLSAYLKERRAMHELNLASVVREGLRSVGVRAVIPSQYAMAVEVEVSEVRLTDFQIEADAVGIWLTSGPAGDGAAEVSVDCGVELELSFFDLEHAWALRTPSLRFAEEGGFVVRSLPLNLAFELSGVGPSLRFPQAISRVSLLPVEYKLRLADDEVPIKYRPAKTRWDDMDDDIPF